MIALKVEDCGYDLLIEALIREGRHLDARALTNFRGDFQSKEVRFDRIVHALILLGGVASIPTAIVLYEPKVGLLWSITLSFAVCMFPAMIAVILMRPAAVVAWNWALASIWYRLAGLAARLIGSEGTGRPLRWFALVLFVIGSFLDLIVSWNQ